MAVSDHIRDPKSASSLSLTSSGALVRGAFVLVGAIYGIVFEAITATEGAASKVVKVTYKCDRIMVPKSTGTGADIAVGATLWLNTTTLVVSDTNGGSDKNVGTCIEAATISDTTVLADLNGQAT